MQRKATWLDKVLWTEFLPFEKENKIFWLILNSRGILKNFSISLTATYEFLEEDYMAILPHL